MNGDGSCCAACVSSCATCALGPLIPTGKAGGLYSHFASKAALVRFIAKRELAKGFETIVTPSPGSRPPAVVLRAARTKMAASAPIGLIVQLWGEATTDDEMRAVVLETLGQLEASLQQAVLPWALTLPGNANDRAAQVAGALRAIIQGYIVQLALFGRAWDQYINNLAAVLTATS